MTETVPDVEVEPDTDGRLRSRASLAGVAAAGVALGVGELVSSFGDTGQSLVAGVGNEIVDRAAGGTVKWAIDLFGTADKTALVVSIVILSLALGALFGRAALRRMWVAVLGFSAFGLVGLLAGVRDPLANDGWVVAAAVCATLAGVATLALLLRVARGQRPVPVTLTGSSAVEVRGRPGDGRASRRAFFAWTGAAGAFAATAALAARSLKERGVVDTARRQVSLPAPSLPNGEAAGVQGLQLNGLSPYVVPNSDFYRIDTALIVPHVDPAGWSLRIDGAVDRPVEITYDELLAMPMVEEAVTIACVSNEVGGKLVGNARWLGVPLGTLLDQAGVQPAGTQIVGRSVDGFTVGFPTEVARDGRTALVAVGMNGEPLPINHGFPARLIVAGLYGYVSATKWLSEIQLTGWDDFDAYWIPRGWAKKAPIKTESRIDVPTAGAQLAAGTTPIAGVAWATGRGISKVEVQVDDGPWVEAELGDVLSDNTWRQWMLPWDATSGEHVLRCRATDGTGALQTEDVAPPEPDGATGWHRRGVTVA